MPETPPRTAAPEAPRQPADAYLTSPETAKRFKVSERFLERLRANGEGPPFVRIGRRRILYRLADCEAWAASRTHAHRAAEMSHRTDAG